MEFLSLADYYQVNDQLPLARDGNFSFDIHTSMWTTYTSCVKLCLLMNHFLFLEATIAIQGRSFAVLYV